MESSNDGGKTVSELIAERNKLYEEKNRFEALATAESIKVERLNGELKRKTEQYNVIHRNYGRLQQYIWDKDEAVRGALDCLGRPSRTNIEDLLSSENNPAVVGAGVSEQETGLARSSAPADPALSAEVASTRDGARRQIALRHNTKTAVAPNPGVMITCPECGGAFKRKRGLGIHKSKMHPGLNRSNPTGEQNVVESQAAVSNNVGQPVASTSAAVRRPSHGVENPLEKKIKLEKN